MARPEDNSARKQREVEHQTDVTEGRDQMPLSPDDVRAANDRIIAQAQTERSDVSARAEELSQKGASAQQQKELSVMAQRAAAAEKNLLHQLDQVERELAAAQQRSKAANSVMSRAIGSEVRKDSDVRAAELVYNDDGKLVERELSQEEEEAQKKSRGFFGRWADRRAKNYVDRLNAQVDTTDAEEAAEPVREQFDELADESTEKRVKALREQKAEIEKKLRSTQGMLSMFKQGERWQLVQELDESQQEYEVARAELVADNLFAALNEQMGDLDQRSATLNEQQKQTMDFLNKQIVGPLNVRRAISLSLGMGASAALLSGAGAAALGLVAGRRALMGGIGAVGGYTAAGMMESRMLGAQIQMSAEGRTGLNEMRKAFFEELTPEHIATLSDEELSKNIALAAELAVERGTRPSLDGLVLKLQQELGKRMQEKMRSPELRDNAAEAIAQFLQEADAETEKAVDQVRQNDKMRKTGAVLGASLMASGLMGKVTHEVVDFVGDVAEFAYDVAIPTADAHEMTPEEYRIVEAHNKRMSAASVDHIQYEKFADVLLARKEISIEAEGTLLEDTHTHQKLRFSNENQVTVMAKSNVVTIQETPPDGETITYTGNSVAELNSNRAEALRTAAPEASAATQATVEVPEGSSVGASIEYMKQRVLEKGTDVGSGSAVGKKIELPGGATLSVIGGELYMQAADGSPKEVTESNYAELVAMTRPETPTPVAEAQRAAAKATPESSSAGVVRMTAEERARAKAAVLDSLREPAPEEAEPRVEAEKKTASIWSSEVQSRVDDLPKMPEAKAVHNYTTLVEAAAKKHGLSPELLQSVMAVESTGNPNARNDGSGAEGLFQLMPDTAKEVGVTDRTDPAQSIDGGAEYLAKQIGRFSAPKYANTGHSPVELGLMAYNMGAGNVEKWLERGAEYSALNSETREYLPKVLHYYDKFGGDGEDAHSGSRSAYTPERVPRKAPSVGAEILSLTAETKADSFEGMVEKAFDTNSSAQEREAAFRAIVEKYGRTLWVVPGKDGEPGEVYHQQNKPRGALAFEIWRYRDRTEFSFNGEDYKSVEDLPELRMHVEEVADPKADPEAEAAPDAPVDAEGKEIVPLAEQSFPDQREAIIDYVYANGEPMGSMRIFDMPNGDQILANERQGTMTWIRSGGRQLEIRSAADLARIPQHDALLIAADPHRNELALFEASADADEPEIEEPTAPEAEAPAREVVAKVPDIDTPDVPESVRAGAERATQRVNEATTRHGVDVDRIDDRIEEARIPGMDKNPSREQRAFAKVMEDRAALQEQVDEGVFGEDAEYAAYVDDVLDEVDRLADRADEQYARFLNAQRDDLVAEQQRALDEYKKIVDAMRDLVSAAEHGADRIGLDERDAVRDAGIGLPGERTGQSILADQVRDNEAPKDNAPARGARKTGFFLKQALREVARADNVLAGMTDTDDPVAGVHTAVADNHLQRAEAFEEYARDHARNEQVRDFAIEKAQHHRDKAADAVESRNDFFEARDERAEDRIEEYTYVERTNGDYRFRVNYDLEQQYEKTPGFQEEAIRTVLAPNYKRYVKEYVGTIGPATNTRETAGPTVQVWDGEQFTSEVNPGPSALDRGVTSVRDAAVNAARPDNVITPEDRAIANLEREALRIAIAINEIQSLEEQIARTTDTADIADMQKKIDAASLYIRGRVDAVTRRYGTNVFLDSNTPGQPSSSEVIRRSMFEADGNGPAQREGFRDGADVTRARNQFDE